MIYQNIKESSSYKPVETMFNGPGTYYVRPRDTSIEDSWDISSKENFERFLKDHPEYAGCKGYKQTTYSHGDTGSNRRGEYWTEKEELKEEQISRYNVYRDDVVIAQDVVTLDDAKRIAKEDDGNIITRYVWHNEEDYYNYAEANEVEDIYLTEEETTEDSFLDSTIDVYDIDAFIKSESNNTLQSFHFHNGGAIILKSDGSGCLVDFEAIGTRFDNVDAEITIDTTEFDPDKRVIYMLPDSRIKTTAKEIMDKAPKRSVKVKDFFTKCQYNDRCERNFYDLRKFLNESMEEAEDSFEYIHEYFPVDNEEALNNTIEELKKDNRYVKHEQVGDEIAVYAKWASDFKETELKESYDMINVIEDTEKALNALITFLSNNSEGEDDSVKVSVIVDSLKIILKELDENRSKAW